jgi:formylglycine-generating enzyme required for sulfatase activity
MRIPPLLGECLVVAMLVASPASAVSMAWTPIGDPGNACDPRVTGCYGSIPYPYSIGTYEVTNAQYVEFLNAKAASDSLALYVAPMDGTFGQPGGITRAGTSGSYTYSVIAGRGDMPVNWLSFYNALRFANWMNNGQGSADTETGAYTLLGGTVEPSNGLTVMRNQGATIVLTSQNEWYKAAYYDPSTASYFDYPAGTDSEPTCAAPSAIANRANCDDAVGDLTIVGSYTGSASPYGTFDQGGNVWEWNEDIVFVGFGVRGFRGGAYNSSTFDLAGIPLYGSGPTGGSPESGFRLAMIPEPSTALLLISGLLGLAGWRRLPLAACLSIPAFHRPPETTLCARSLTPL